jgi:hypothetical protein
MEEHEVLDESYSSFTIRRTDSIVTEEVNTRGLDETTAVFEDSGYREISTVPLVEIGSGTVWIIGSSSEELVDE